ncbi:MAG: right-handed parallel beta-helix repeat-containing protein [Spirochaetota bacterium]
MLALLLIPAISHAQVASNTNTGATYADIPSAINAAANGQTIVVFAGTHNTNIVIAGKTNFSFISWPWIQSADNTAAIIDGTGFTSLNSFGITLTNSAGIRVEGFTVRLFTNGIYMRDYLSNCTIANNNIYSNGPYTTNCHNGGIYLYGDSVVSNFILSNNVWKTLGIGICIWNADRCIYKYNTVYWNSQGGFGNPNWSQSMDYSHFEGNSICSNFATGWRGWGINRYNMFISNAIFSNTGNGFDLPSSYYNTFISNNVCTNGGHGFSGSWSTYSNMIRYNDIRYNNLGVLMSGEWGSDRSNYIVSNRIIHNRSDGVRISYADYNWIIGNDIVSNAARGIMVDATTNGATVSNRIVENNIADNTNEGIYLVHDAVNTCFIASNSVSGNSYGIRIGDSDTNTVIGNIICSNRLEGIYLIPANPPSANFTPTNCVMNIIVSNYIFGHTSTANGRGILIADDRSDSNRIVSNIIFENRIGMHNSEAEYQEIVFNILTNNTSYNFYSDGTYDGNRGCGLIAYNNIYGGAATNMRVNGGWAATNLQTNYFGTLQSSAITAGIDGNLWGMPFYAPYRLGPIGIFQADTTAPVPPVITNAATNTSGEIIIEWQAVGGATGYRVYRETGAAGYNVTAPYSNVGAAITSITDTAVAIDTPYSYYVTAYDAAVPLENESWFSAPATVTVYSRAVASNMNTGAVYYTLNTAVTNAANGHTVVMFAGTNLTENIMITGKTNFSLIGLPWIQSADNTAAIIDGAGIPGPFSYGIIVSNAMNIRIEGMSVRNFINGIYLWGDVSNCVIANNNVYSNGIGYANYGCGGIHIFSNSTISNTVSGNRVWGNRTGIILSNTSSNVVMGNFCYANQTFGIGSPYYNGQNRVGNRIENNIICSNGSTGLYMPGYFISNTIVSNAVFNNSGNGMYIDAHRFGNIISNSVFRNTAYGIHMNGGGTMDYNLYYLNSIYENTSYGIYIEAENADRNLILSNTIWSNLNGIRFQNADQLVIASNLIYSNVNHGIALLNATNIGTRTNLIFNNVVFGNIQQGIYLYANGVIDTFVASNIVFGNVETGIRIYQADTNKIIGNIVFSNGRAGIYIDESGQYNTIESNIVFGHMNASYAGIGIVNENADTNTVSSNLIFDNAFGMRISSPDGCTFTYNTISNNTYAALYSDGAYDGNAGPGEFSYNTIYSYEPYTNVRINANWANGHIRSNYWGSINAGVLSNRICDFPASTNFFSPYLLSPVGIWQTDKTPTAVPAGVTASAGLLNRIVIDWGNVGGATAYRIYRSMNNDAWSNFNTPLVETTVSILTDITALSGNDYYYYITALDNATPFTNESWFSASSGVGYINSNYTVTVSITNPSPNTWISTNRWMYAGIFTTNNDLYFSTNNAPFIVMTTTNTLGSWWTNLSLPFGAGLITNVFSIKVSNTTIADYWVETITNYFDNTPPAGAITNIASNQVISNVFTVLGTNADAQSDIASATVSITNADGMSVNVAASIGSGVFSAAWNSTNASTLTNGEYHIYLTLVNGAGLTVSSPSTPIMISNLWPSGSLATVYAQNNPYRGSGDIVFKDLTTNSSVSIYTVSGKLMAKLVMNADNTSGQLAWNVIADNGKFVSPGVYLCLIKSNAGTRVIRIMIVRRRES